MIENRGTPKEERFTNCSFCDMFYSVEDLKKLKSIQINYFREVI